MFGTQGGFSFGSAAPASAAGTTATTSSAFGFAAPSATTSSAFGFAAPSATTSSAFGFAAPSATTSSAFGFAAPSATTSSAFGFAAPSATTSSAFGFAAPSATTSSAFGFAAPTAATSSGFGFPSSTATTSAFGFPTSTSSFAFGAAPSAAATSVGGAFGSLAKPTTASGFGFGGGGFGFAGGATKPTLSGFGQLPNAAAAAANAATAAASVAFFNSLAQPGLFPDERDAALARWNQLQAQWGTGKGFCSQRPVEYTASNPFNRLKAVCYNLLPASREEDGLVGLTVTRPAAEVAEAGVKDALFRVLGNKPCLTPMLEETRPLEERLCQLVVYVREQLPTGGVRRIPSGELAAFLSQPMLKQQLATQLQVTAVQALTRPSRDQLSQYLDRPPAGVPVVVWQQARRENPDPESLLPVPLVGLDQALARVSAQRAQCRAQQRLLGGLAARCERLRVDQAAAAARLDAAKRRQLELGRRTVRLVCRQEVARRSGQTLLPAEEQLRSAVDHLLAQLPAGRLRELVSQVKLGVRHQRDAAAAPPSGLQLDPASQEAVMAHLAGQHKSIGELVRFVKGLAADLNAVDGGLA